MFTFGNSDFRTTKNNAMEEEYLEVGFDPKTLKVAQLRRILLEHEVTLTTGLKKADLCELFERHIKPRREELLKSKETGPGKEVFEQSSEISASREASAGRSESPFSDVNDFQQESVLPQKRRRDKDSGKEKKKKGRRAKTVDSPIVDKVQHMKSPSKPSPHKSLVIEKFESSSDHSSNSDDIADFSFRRRTVSPDLSKLRVSPAFAEQLLKAAKQSQSTPTKGVKLEEQENHPPNEHENTPSHLSSTAKSRSVSKEASFENMPSFSGIKDESSPIRIAIPKRTPDINEEGLEEEIEKSTIDRDSAQNKGLPATTEPSESSKSDSDSPASPVSSTTPLADQEEDNETVESSEAEDNDDSIAVTDLEKEVSVQKITTPELATEDDVKKIEEDVTEAEKSQSVIPKKRTVRPFLLKVVKRSFKGLFHLVVFLSVILSILFGLWYREERIQVGYCGREINLPTFQNPDNLPWLQSAEIFLQQFKPKCLPCPENAICYPYMQIKCRPDYMVTHSAWSLHGLFPLSDYCVKDSKREKLISEVVKKSLELLRTKNAQIKCGESEDDFESGISNEELYQIFYESRAPWINSEEFDDLWVQIVQDLKNEPEITWRQLPTPESDTTRNSDSPTDTDDIQEPEGDFQNIKKQGTFRSTSKKYIGLKCKFEREVHQTYQRFKYVIWTIVLSIVVVEGLKYKLRRYFKQQEKIDQLTQQVLIKLRSAARDADDSKPPYLSTVQLRDVLLVDIVDLKDKNQLWQMVTKKLENNNTNIKSSLMELHGEIMKCWQWIGPFEGE